MKKDLKDKVLSMQEKTVNKPIGECKLCTNPHPSPSPRLELSLEIYENEIEPNVM